MEKWTTFSWLVSLERSLGTFFNEIRTDILVHCRRHHSRRSPDCKRCVWCHLQAITKLEREATYKWFWDLSQPFHSFFRPTEPFKGSPNHEFQIKLTLQMFQNKSRKTSISWFLRLEIYECCISMIFDVKSYVKTSLCLVIK